MRTLFALLCIAVSASADEFRWAITDTPSSSFSWCVTETIDDLAAKGGDSGSALDLNTRPDDGSATVISPEPGSTADHAAPPASLRQRIAAYRSRGGVAYYEGGGSVLTSKRHLVSDHGFRMEELTGLSQSELDYLHGMRHTNARELTMGAAQPVATVEPCDDGGYPVTRMADNNYHWSNPRLGHRYYHELKDGWTYGGMVYRNGKMWEKGTEPAVPVDSGRIVIPVPSVEPLIQPPQKPLVNTQGRTGHWERQCDGTSCRMVWVWN